jgi:DNA-binding GntR family transcriptional regulator
MELVRERQVERIESPTLVDQIVERIVHGIASGRLPRGARVVEHDIANDLGISRIPLREAMSILEQQRILLAEPRRGRRVADFTPEDVVQMGQARLAVERLAVLQAAAKIRANPSLIQPLDGVLEEMRGAQREPVNQMWINTLDISFHSAVYAITQNDFLQMLWNAMSSHVFISFAVDQSFRRLVPSEILAQHEHLRNLLLAGSDEELEREIQVHIMSYGRGLEGPLASVHAPQTELKRKVN